MLKNIARALRLPFITASILPFVCGSLLAKKHLDILAFLLGLISVCLTHLSANLINDYADSKSGADWKDKKFYGFFGGSKLIQEKIFSQEFYLNFAIFLSVSAFASIIILAFVIKSITVIGFYLLILFLAFSYSEGFLRFSYRRLGEVIIFMLFGPALVMGGYFIQTKIFPSIESFVLSLPFGFLTSAILFANEVPDFPQDLEAHKFTWVAAIGQKKAFVLYYILIALAFFSIVLNIILGYLSILSLLSFVFVFMGLKSARILRHHFGNKTRLIESSRLTVALQTVVGLIIVLDIIV